MRVLQHIATMVAILTLKCDGDELKPSLASFSDGSSLSLLKDKEEDARNLYYMKTADMSNPSRFQNVITSYKRVPSGFLGMRGKKEYIEIGEELNKRVPSGFLGMRGKKEDFQLNSFEDDYGTSSNAQSDVYEMAKRPSKMGFLGMRGKKLPGHSSFFGMRGKKYPYQFRGKFVGVRGKKSDWNDYRDLSNLAQQLDLNQLMLLLTANDYEFLSKNDRNNEVV
ncbi:tachykinins [Agrilus planipennis]|uniref:Tachykinins n=1 Tax=Agrilus planipennis TaxID=224129 RepID=A0A1W4WPQ8_AGRPL|nr:tachykinins [Agrilus planipennis]XP_018322099.1 tachykinins [Agrilus planipennis]